MQEFGHTKGLSLIEGKVVKFDKSRMVEDLKIPPIWAGIEQ